MQFARSSLLLVTALLATATLPAQNAPAPENIAQLHERFLHPPDDARIMMRWWWFGPAATKPEITRELEEMKAAGIGGVEIANLYPLALDAPATGFHNTPYLSPEHLEALSFANREARRLGLRLDITLCSGWPFGGPHIPITEAAGKLRVETQLIAASATSAAAPFIDSGESLLSAYVIPTSASPSETAKAEQLAPPQSGRFSFPSASQPRTLVTFLSSRTGMMVKRPSVGAAGFVLDHYDKAATEHHLHEVGDRLLSAFGDHPPYAIFSDSLEVYGSDWTPALLDEFQRRRGYDLRSHLLALVKDAGPETAAVRHDWGRTLTELADENFIAPMQAWAKEHHTLLRSQSYGFPPVTLSSNRLADLPEGEGKATFQMWREFSDTRWAASAGHLFHRPVISSETWTWLHSPAFRATPLDMKAEADLHFLQGINQLVGHGWPYSPESAGEPGWRMYAAAALDAHNPWFGVMPDLTRYLQRVSFALRQGEPANDVALLLPNDDIWATFSARIEKHASATSAAGFDESGSNVSIDEAMDKRLGKQVIAQVLDAGFNLDFIDPDAIETVGIPYKVLILPAVDRLPVAIYQKILDFARQGGIVIATGHAPTTAPGLLHAAEDSARLQQLSQQLFHGNIPTAHLLANENELGAALARYTPPDMTLTPRSPQIGFIHRHLPSGDLYFVANTSNQPRQIRAHFRSAAAHAEIWDPVSGEVSGTVDLKSIPLNLEPYESRLIVFSEGASTIPAPANWLEQINQDLSHDWTVTFGSNSPSQTMASLKSWTTDAKTQFFSGQASYEKTFTLPKPAPGTKILLDFGPGTPETVPPPNSPHNMHAYLDSPIREAAQIYLNGQPAGVVWHPPYRLDITPYLREGQNQLRILVSNTAINALAGQSLPDYRLLWDRYGMLFVPQDMHDLHPLPSGILGPVRLIEAHSAQ
jgi:alpha-L-rhamnosidase